MNYLEIILKGYSDKNTKQFFKKYLYREFKKAEKEQFFEADEFFNGCLKVVKGLENQLEEHISKRRYDLHLLLSHAENGTLKYGDLKEGETISQKRLETIKYCTEELQKDTPDGVQNNVNLFSLTQGRFTGCLSQIDILLLKGHILSAYSKAKEETAAILPKQKKPEPIPIKYTAYHHVLTYLIECNANGESFPIGHKKELERIGNQRMGTGKGNRFYKVFNEIVQKDLNSSKSLIEIGGENWRTIVKTLSNEPEIIEEYLQSKKL
ncbi:hypothetical protein ACFOSV_13840 [Algoriphagus namhaensis]|uniref:Abortive infection Abi-like protein n=1 Tax=Algoriphagus namhaensis TaxID=915353 RepID=A0ABV8AUB9_9BACT